MSSAPGITSLSALIASMSPYLDPIHYVYVDFASLFVPASLLSDYPDAIQMLFREDEGWTGIVRQDVATSEKLEKVMFPCRRIALRVYSSLDAVGFLAAVTRRLATLEIGVNPVSACLYDHLFVPVGTEEAVMEALREMVAEEGVKI